MSQGYGETLFAFSILHHLSFVIVGLVLSEDNIFLFFLTIVCEVSSPLIIYTAFLRTLPHSAVSFLRLGNQEHVQHSR